MHKHNDTKTHGQVVALSVVLSQYKLMVVHTIYVQALLKRGRRLQQLRRCSVHLCAANICPH